MARQTGANNFAGTLEVLAAAPLDARSVIPTKTDLTASGNFPYPYIGMQTYVVAENKRYTLIGSDPTVLANWREDGSGSGSSIQVTALPTASVTELGNVYQYIGTTTASYTNGYFYKCISDGAVTPTYSWVQLNVQPSGGSGGGGGIIANATLLASGWNSTTRQQTLTFTDYDPDMGGVIGVPALASQSVKNAYAESIINVVAQNNNQFTFEAETVPSIDLPVTLYAGGGSGGSGSGGHTIKNDAGTALTQRDNLQFKNATVTDNGIDTTVVETEKIQYATMPAASVSNAGQIVQYIGETTTVAPIYVKGLFYEVAEDTSTTPSTYSWVETTVQEHPDVDLTNVFASGMPVASVSGDRRFNYQTDEHEVGTWIDGRTVYQIVCVYNSEETWNSNTWHNTSLSVTGIDLITDVTTISSTGTVSKSLMCAKDDGRTYVQILNMRNNTLAVKYAIIQYTKTT